MERLDGWKRDLAVGDQLELSEVIGFVGVDAGALAATLGATGSLRVEAGEGSDLATGRLRVPIAADDLAAQLGRLARADRRARLVDGAPVACLGLGALTFGGRTAPLAVLPVELAVVDGEYELVLAGAARTNPLLAARLARDYEIVLPAEGYHAISDAAASIALTRGGAWHVARTVTLGALDARRAIACELAADVATITESAHPLLERLATSGGPAMTLGAVAIDDVLAPLDADGAQLAAIAAAGAGASFVLDGPPGTGKTQTLANLVVHCATQGKSVLVVAETPAAREGVLARLAAIGLGDACLALDGEDAKLKGAVLAQLGRVLDRSFRPGSGPAGGLAGDARLADARAALDRHATAMHATGPFGRSLHEVIGRLVELRTTPNASLAESDATALDRASFDRRLVAVTALGRAAVAVEPVATHAWRASTLERWPLASDDRDDRRKRTLGALAEARGAGDELADAVREVVALVPGLAGRRTEQLAALGALAAVAAASPRPGAELLTQMRAAQKTLKTDELGERIALVRARGTGTIEVPRDPATFLALAARHRQLATEVDDRFTEAVADLDLAGALAQLKKWTSAVGPLRFVALRTVRAEVKAAALPGELNSDAAMIDALEAAIAERACRAALVGATEPAKRWFGELGGEPLSLDLAKIDAAVTWAGELRRAFDATEIDGADTARTAAWRALVAQVGASESDELEVFRRTADAVLRWQQAIAALADATGIPAAGLGAGVDHLGALGDQVAMLEQAIDALPEWAAFHAARTAARAVGVGAAVVAIERGDLGAEELAPAWERATLVAWGDAELAESEPLGTFHGAAHHAGVAAFADLDRAGLAVARTRAIARLAERVPARRDADPTGELAVLVDELKRAGGGRIRLGDTAVVPVDGVVTRSLRELLAAIPTLLARLAPCIVASPLAVARYLDPALPRFDVVAFDEASRVPVAHALGAIARAGAIVVIGDERQLAPVDGSESLLAACTAAALPRLALATHYRSKHEDLFAIANRLAYADRLVAFPVAQGSADLGITWRRVDSEADAVVAELVARLRDPGQRARSYAAIALTESQRDRIAVLLDAACAAEPALGEARARLAEPLLVETPAAMQGQERDVVIVAVGDGVDAARDLSAGEATVAFTRAREQMIVVSGFAPEELAGGFVAEQLAFARAGGGAARATAELAASPITEAIGRALAERGWTVRHQVGCGAYRLDLAVVDPSDPERCVLAIEHDGRAYAGASGARDRDRLRAQQLAALGWRTHRIWTLDWWSDAEREVQRAHGAIVAAIAATRTRRAPMPVAARARSTSGRHAAQAALPVLIKIPPKTAEVVAAAAPDTDITLATGSGPAEVLVGEGSAPISVKRGAIAIGPYSAAAIPAGRRAPDDMFAPRHAAELAKILEQVLAAEAPMHLHLLARRAGAYFGIGRLSARVIDQVKAALAGRARFGAEDGIVWRLDQDPASVPPVRVAGSGSEARRGIAEVPLAELASAARIVVERAGGIAAHDLVRDTARLLGFARITDEVTARVHVGVRLAAQRELIAIVEGRASIPS